MKNFVKAHFLPRRQAIVKMNGTRKIELCRRKAKKIMSTCKKYHSIFPPFFLVENPCGKTCGECGKLKVINRYFASLPFHGPGRLPNFWADFPVMFPAGFSIYVTGITATLSVRLSRKSWSCKQNARFLV